MSRISKEGFNGSSASENGANQSSTRRAGDIECPEWARLIRDQEWEVYDRAIQALRQVGVRFVLGGAFGLAAYTQHWRNTKDIDFFLLAQDRDSAVQALTTAGFQDYYDRLSYDRGWIYRATRADAIVDLIWGTPNRRTGVDRVWFEHSQRLKIRTELLEAMPAEELLWIKLYVLQRDRCDWPDIINLLYSTARSLDWERLVDRLQDDLPLLLGALTVFAWVCPGRVGHIPAKLRKLAGLRVKRSHPPGPNLERLKLLDTRPWFAALQPCDEPMKL